MGVSQASWMKGWRGQSRSAPCTYLSMVFQSGAVSRGAVGVVETMKVSSLNPNSKWANQFTTGSLSFLVCKMGTHPVPSQS